MREADEFCSGDSHSAAGVYLFVISILHSILYILALYLIYRLVARKTNRATTFEPWYAGITVVPFLFLSMGIELGGFGVDCSLGCAAYAAYGASISFVAGTAAVPSAIAACGEGVERASARMW